jgi:hypothetical protein
MWRVYDYHRGGVCGRVYVYQGGVYVYQGPTIKAKKYCSMIELRLELRTFSLPFQIRITQALIEIPSGYSRDALIN